WAMATLSVALFGHVAQSSLMLMVAALAMMLVVNLLLAWRLPTADQVLLPMATMLTGLGLVMIRRLSPEYSLRQLAGIGVGLLLLQYVGPLFMTWLLALGLLLFQNDLGSALLFFGIFLAMVYVAGPRRIYSLMGLAMVVVGALAAYQLNRHVRARIITWINPW